MIYLSRNKSSTISSVCGQESRHQERFMDHMIWKYTEKIITQNINILLTSSLKREHLSLMLEKHEGTCINITLCKPIDKAQTIANIL